MAKLFCNTYGSAYCISTGAIKMHMISARAINSQVSNNVLLLFQAINLRAFMVQLLPGAEHGGPPGARSALQVLGLWEVSACQMLRLPSL